MKLSIPEKDKQGVLSSLKTANTAFAKIYPGDSPERQPVHTVYGGANLFKSDTTVKMGAVALNNFRTYAPDFTVLAKALELPGYEALPSDQKSIDALKKRFESDASKGEKGRLAFTVYNKIIKKLEREALEDFRIDFEDGYGNRPDAEEDATAVFTANEVAKGMKDGTLSPFIGIRIKPFTEELKNRSVRTLDIFVSTLVEASGGKLPANFVVTLPKVQIPEQVSALVRLFEMIEANTKLEAGSLKMEFMVETTQSIMSSEGKSPLLAMVMAGEGRVTGAHFGTYDYTASCNITAKYQKMDHPVCDFAHHMMKVALGGTGVWLSDGATNVMPVGPHRGKELTAQQQKENTEVVHRAWKIAYDHNRHSLWKGIYQGWDLHPAQLPIRYAAVYSFFLESYDDAALRLHNFMEKAGQATLSGDVFDDAATGQGLLNFFLIAMNCGAIGEEDLLATSLTMEDIRTRSFVKILDTRRKNTSAKI
jgi:citrate lyase beta subunit